MDLTELQFQHKAWLAKNFPNQKLHEPLLGLMEEVGELAHAHLKHDQEIRGLAEIKQAYEKKEDAIGDIVIYLASYCNTNSFDLDRCVRDTWEKVRNRDWQSDSLTGGEV
jgi:NTP pyrophosphatase (non-canonical NTP hydrolase)